MRRRDLTDIVSSLALLHLLWGLYTYCSLSSHLLLCVLVIHHLHVHREESGANYISENSKMDQHGSDSPDEPMDWDDNQENTPEPMDWDDSDTSSMERPVSGSNSPATGDDYYQSNRWLIHSLHGEAAHNACATTERLESRLSVGGSPQLPNIPRNNTTDLEPSMTSMAASGVSNDQPYAESEHSGHDPLSGSDLKVDNEAESHSVNYRNGHDVNVDEPNESVAAETDGLVVDTATVDESKVDRATPDESPKENAVLPKTDYLQNQTLDDTKENLKTTDKPSNLTSQHLEDKVCKDSSLIIDRTPDEREVSLSRSNSPTNLRKDEDAVNPVSIYDVSRNRENKQVPGPQQADMRKAGKSCVSTRHQGNPGQRSETGAAVFSPTDDLVKLQSHQMEHYPQATSSDPVLLPTYPLVDGQHHETTESSIPENTDVCKNQMQRPGPTLTDRKTQKARSSDQDNVCLNGQPSSSQEAAVESHPTKLEAQKKQKGTDADVEKEDTPLDGRPSVKDKHKMFFWGTTPLTEGPANLTCSMSEMAITLSAGSHQNGNQPITIQHDHTEKWPTESSSDSE